VVGADAARNALGLISKPAAALKRVRENSVVPPGLESFFLPFPARWAKLGRPSGAAFSWAWFHQTVRKLVLTHTLKRCPRYEAQGFPYPEKAHPITILLLPRPCLSQPAMCDAKP
jgi:hypothetical protein